MPAATTRAQGIRTPLAAIALVAILGGGVVSGPQSEWHRITPVPRDPVAERASAATLSERKTAMPQSSDSPQPPPMPAIRLIFEYEGDRVRLIASQPVDMAVTGFDLQSADRPGYYVDVRSASEQTLARVPARGAFASSVEVFPENHSEPITRIDDPSRKGAFTVVVPAPETGDHVTLMQLRLDAAARVRSEDGPNATPVTAVDLASFPLAR